MIQRDKLSNELAKILQIKNNLVPLLDKHVGSSLFFSDMDPAKREKILQRLRQGVKKQIKHVEILNQILGEIKGAKKDVY